MSTFTRHDLWANLPPPAECLGILLGCAEITIFGLGGLANRVEFSKAYGLPIVRASTTQTHPGALEAQDATEKTTGSQAERTQEALIAAIAARNLQNGVLLVALGCYVRDRRALGVAVLVGLVTTGADLWIVQSYGVREAAFGHVFGLFNSLAIGGSLLYWARTDPWW